MKTKKLCLFGTSILFIVFGLFLILMNQVFLKYIIATNLVLVPDSKVYDSWKQVPFSIPMDFYLFNWTNPKDIHNKTVKPKLEQVGPYRFMLDLKKTDIVWNDNGTVTYRQKKFWHFSPEGTKGSLNDTITIINSPPLGAAHVARSWSYFVRKTISLTLSGISATVSVTRTVDEILFTGFPDALTSMANTLPIFSGEDIPKWDKFGLLYKMNGTSGLDGIFTMGTGIDSTFGKLYKWNYKTQNPYFEQACNKVEGSTGDNFDLSGGEDTIKMFVPDLCRALTLEYVGDAEVGGIPGRKYVIDDYVLDNGTKYPKNQCYCTGDCAPSGTFNVSSCRFGSPTFLSLPHFYKADPYYTGLVEGLKPEKDKHEFYMIVEPNTGIPLQVNTRLQVNFLLHSVPDISLYEEVPTIFFPIMWFDQKATVPENEISNIKLLLNIPTMCISFGAVIATAGVAVLIYLVYISMHQKKPETRKESEEDVPLRHEDKTVKS